MRRELKITRERIEETTLLANPSASGDCGAAVVFFGRVREMENGEPIAGLDYEVFGSMAEHQFQLLFDELERRWPVQSVRVVHRVGFVRVSETSLWVELTAAHRAEAFAACQWLIDEMKRVVPIWKKKIAENVFSGVEGQLKANLEPGEKTSPSKKTAGSG